MDLIILTPLIFSFILALLMMPAWIKKAKNIGLIWENMNKFERKKELPGSGGLIVVLGFIFGVLIYIFLKTFYFKSQTNVVEIFALTTSILIFAGIGLIDDLLGWQHGGLSRRFRIILCLFAAVPLIVINAGSTRIILPILGNMNLGLIYALVIIPIGIVGTSTTFNFLAGFNGLEASQGIIVLVALSLVAYLTGYGWLALIGMCMVLSLLAFLYYNKFPAQILPGDVLTYPIGGMIAVIAIMGNMEKIAIFFFIPYIFEVILKSRGKLKKYSFGKPNMDNSLEMPYDKIYGLEHFAILALKKIKPSHKVYEKDVVYFINFMQLVFIILGLVIFRKNIFV